MGTLPQQRRFCSGSFTLKGRADSAHSARLHSIDLFKLSRLHRTLSVAACRGIDITACGGGSGGSRSRSPSAVDEDSMEQQEQVG